jgi:peptide/nickel transport system permease protein
VRRYLARRSVFGLLVLLGVSLITFSLTYLVPADPALVIAGPRATGEAIASIRAQLGLDRPVYVRYGEYLWRLLHLDLGTSYLRNRPVLGQILDRFGATVQLALACVLMQLLIGLPIGVLSAVKQRSLSDRAAMVFSLLFLSAPPFWLGLMLLFLLGFLLPIFPLGGYGTPLHIVLPALTLGLSGSAWYARMLRSSMLEILSADYVRTARGKGLRERVVVVRHALQNAVPPILTMAGMDLGRFAGGLIVVETVFGWPGIGQLALEALYNFDVPMVMGVVLFSAMLVVLMNLVVDVAYGVLDPRIKYQ